MPNAILELFASESFFGSSLCRSSFIRLMTSGGASAGIHQINPRETNEETWDNY